MRQVITFEGPHQLSPLHDEILAALSHLRPIPSGNIIDLEVEYHPVMGVSGTDTHIWIEIPEGIDPEPVKKIVDAHIRSNDR